MTRISCWTASALCLSVSLFAPAAEAASSIQNKTVVVTYSHYVPATCADGATHMPARNVTQTIYVSSQGRVFAKLSGRAGNAAKERLVEPTGGGNFHLSGNQIIGTFPQISGATQLTVTLDASGQSCNASVVAGTESGKAYSWRNLVGVTCTATGPGVFSNVGCSVHEGNAFAN